MLFSVYLHALGNCGNFKEFFLQHKKSSTITLQDSITNGNERVELNANNFYRKNSKSQVAHNTTKVVIY